MEPDAPPVVAEIAELLDQCTQEELSSILQTMEGTGLVELSDYMLLEDEAVDGAEGSLAAPTEAPTAPTAPAAEDGAAPIPPAVAPVVAEGESTAVPAAEVEPPPSSVPAQETEAAQAGDAAEAAPAIDSPADTAAAPPLAPVPPAGPPPGPGGRRPSRRQPPRQGDTGGDGQGEVTMTMDQLKRMLEEHGAGVLAEARQMLSPTAGGGGGGGFVDDDAIDLAMLTQALSEKDFEVSQLEGRLAELQSELETKGERVGELGSELEGVVREVRHRQLDLEFQQLKLDERIRGNADLEHSQRQLATRVEEAGLSARHAALDLDISRAITTPRGIRAQGSLPWTLRKNRPACVDPAAARR